MLQLEDSCNDMCSVCCVGLEKCNLQVYRACMSEYEHMCRNCEEVIECDTLNSPLRTVTIKSNFQFNTSLNSTRTDNVAPTSPNNQINTAVCNDKGMMACDTAGIGNDNKNKNFISQPKSKTNSSVYIKSQTATEHISYSVFQTDTGTQTPQNLNKGSNSLEGSKLNELRQKEVKLRKLEKDLSLRENL